jgi:uncharacterized protein YprB with RNaseH-like and TPR domain
LTADTLLARLRGLNLGAPPAAPSPAAGAKGRLPGAVLRLPGGAVHVAEWSAPCGDGHGRATLDAHADARALAAAAASRDARFRDLDPARWLFIDTETTSLNSGAGVWVFMVGVGWLEGGRFRVRQFLLTDPGAEPAMLAAVHERVRASDAIVSFHGKSFDAPRLDDRFRLTGLEGILAPLPHLDLLHPLRRLHGHWLPDCRLRTVEEELLGFVRIDDLPGALCPEAYFAYLRGRPHRLADVFEHNRLDVLSLTALAGHLALAYGGGDVRISALRAGLDWARAGESARASELLSAAAAALPRGPVSVALEAARWLGRLGHEAGARRLLLGLAERHPEDQRPGLALKRLERRARRALATPPAAPIRAPAPSAGRSAQA